MADDDLSTRLHWPADPLEGAAAAGRPAAGPGTASPRAAATNRSNDGLGSPDDVALLRREVADLRHAVDDLADRVQLRQLRASFDELRDEVIALRRVVVVWPELDHLTTEVGALRSQLLDLQEDPPVAPPDPTVTAALHDLRSTIEGLASARTRVGSLAPILEEIGTLREEMVSLRRRIALRGQSTDAVLDDDRLEGIVESMVDRVVAATSNRRRR